MAKKRKSREQKIKADTRHFHYHFEPVNTPKTISVSPSEGIKPRTQDKIESHPYLKHDLRRTLALTATILGSQIALFLVLKIHTFPFLGIRY